MGYVIAGILVLLIVAGLVTFLVLNSTRRQSQSAAEREDYGEGTPGSNFGILASDGNTPLGDTDQHAGEHSRDGETVNDPEHERGDAPARPGGGGSAGGEGGLGGEAEGGRRITPESERLANRSR
jgi:hypothetical protein